MAVSFSIRTNRPGPGRQDGISYSAYVFIVHSIVVLVYLAEALGAWYWSWVVDCGGFCRNHFLSWLPLWCSVDVRRPINPDGIQHRRLFSSGRVRPSHQRLLSKYGGAANCKTRVATSA